MEMARRTRSLQLGSLETMPEVFANPQFKARGFWRTLEHPETGRAFAYPGPFARFAATPIAYRRRPPGDWRAQSRRSTSMKWGLSEERMRELQADGNYLMADEKPLSGVKICDFTWAMAAPAATRVLADFGATVVRIEPINRFDAGRTMPPFRNNEPGPENSAMWSNMGAGKLEHRTLTWAALPPAASRSTWCDGRACAWNHSRPARCASGGSITNRCAGCGPTSSCSAAA